MSVFLILIFFIGGVSASSENDTQLLSQCIGEVVNEDNTDEILTVEVSSAGSNDSGLKELDNINKSRDILKASNDDLLSAEVHVEGNTFNDIQTAINSASAGDTIFLDGKTYTGSGSVITISKNINIYGGSNIYDVSNAILDAKNLSGILSISFTGRANSNVNLKNLKFINAYTTDNYDGGAILCRDTSGTGKYNDSLKISNCNFINNHAYKGSAVLVPVFADYLNISISKCNFENNTGSSVVEVSTPGTHVGLNAENSNFRNNSGTSIYVDYALPSTVINCNFTKNTRGISYLAYSPLYVKGCNFIENGNGGAIYLRNGVIIDCNFTKNTASNGGAISTFQNVKNLLNVSGCSFISNSATNNGGAISGNNLNGDFINISSCTFFNNTATNSGSAIYNYNGSSIDSVFIDNNAGSDKLTGSIDGLLLTLTFTGKDNFINAIYSTHNMSFSNVTYWNGEIVNSDDVVPIFSNQEVGINITVEIYDSNNKLVDNVTYKTNNIGQIVYDYSKLDNKKYSYKAYHMNDSYYTYIETTGTITGPKHYNIIVLDNKTYNISKVSTRIQATIKDNISNQNIKPTNTKLLFIYLHKL